MFPIIYIYIYIYIRESQGARRSLRSRLPRLLRAKDCTPEIDNDSILQSSVV